jgi:hypothetical protein
MGALSPLRFGCCGYQLLLDMLRDLALPLLALLGFDLLFTQLSKLEMLLLLISSDTHLLLVLVLETMTAGFFVIIVKIAAVV